MAEINPNCDVSIALWNMLEASAAFCAMVLPGCRIKYHDDKTFSSPDKPNKITSDYPEVDVINTHNIVIQDSTSTDWSVEQRWSIRMRTGRVFAYKEWELFWIILKACSHWRTYVGAVTYNGISVAKSSWVTGNAEHPDTYEDKKTNMGIQQWTSVWGLTVMIHVNHTTLEAVPTP